MPALDRNSTEEARRVREMLAKLELAYAQDSKRIDAAEIALADLRLGTILDETTKIIRIGRLEGELSKMRIDLENIRRDRDALRRVLQWAELALDDLSITAAG